GALQVDGPRLTQLGRYDVQVRSRTGDAEAWPAVVNLPAPESDLLSASRVELAAALGPLPHEFISATDAFVDAGEQSRRELWRFLLLLGVAALLGEQALGWRFGLPRAAARSAAARQGVLGRILSWRSGRVVRGTR
ncbi:MAG: hypothetical protein HUU27_09730, partial [Phycisphaerae bacterium]|nr:hypothetical protein [Phycisphaerae bacterium]